MATPKLLTRIGVPHSPHWLCCFYSLFSASGLLRSPITSLESSYIEDGLVQLDNTGEGRFAGALAAGAAARGDPGETICRVIDIRQLSRLSFADSGSVFILPGSCWVLRCGTWREDFTATSAGFIALALYTFSPVMWPAASQVEAILCGLGRVWADIYLDRGCAYACTLRAKSILWNWRRILLLGISIAICVGAQFPICIVLLPALAFMLWVGHVRRGAALVFSHRLRHRATLLSGAFTDSTRDHDAVAA